MRKALSFYPFASILCFLVVGCGDDSEPQAPPAPAIAWEDCGGGFECATFSVPVDDDAPNGAAFAIPLVRKPAAQPSKRIGSLLVNPGGPGGSGVSWARAAWVALPEPLKDSFDLVGFDPRGQAGSTPSIDCLDDLTPFVSLDLTPDDAAERQTIVDVTDALVAGCSQRSNDILPFVGTDHIVQDMDRLRAALGDDKLSFLGFSYGTFLGTIYAETFPDRVRALVLDAPLDPKLTGEDFIKGQALAFEANLEAFLDDCAANTACAFHSGGDPRAAYDALVASIEASPLPAPPGGARYLGPGEFSYAVASPLYRTSNWKKLAEALAKAATGDGSALLALSDGYVGRSKDGSYGNSMEVYYGVTSIDSTFAKDPAFYEAMTTELAVTAPRLGATFPYTALPSARWSVAPWRAPGPVKADGAAPILVVGSTGDPATPHDWAVSLASQLSSAVLLTREGFGHVAFLKNNTCIDQAIVDYLVELKLPADGTICK